VFLLGFVTLLTRARALEAASGGDGALAKVGQELQALYQAYRMAQERSQWDCLIRRFEWSRIA
jgi:hypothetical protein